MSLTRVYISTGKCPYCGNLIDLDFGIGTGKKRNVVGIPFDYCDMCHRAYRIPNKNEWVEMTATEKKSL